MELQYCNTLPYSRLKIFSALGANRSCGWSYVVWLSLVMSPGMFLPVRWAAICHIAGQVDGWVLTGDCTMVPVVRVVIPKTWFPERKMWSDVWPLHIRSQTGWIFYDRPHTRIFFCGVHYSLNQLETETKTNNLTQSNALKNIQTKQYMY